MHRDARIGYPRKRGRREPAIRALQHFTTRCVVSQGHIRNWTLSRAILYKRKHERANSHFAPASTEARRASEYTPRVGGTSSRAGWGSAACACVAARRGCIRSGGGAQQHTTQAVASARSRRLGVTRQLPGRHAPTLGPAAVGCGRASPAGAVRSRGGGSSVRARQFNRPRRGASGRGRRCPRCVWARPGQGPARGRRCVSHRGTGEQGPAARLHHV